MHIAFLTPEYPHSTCNASGGLGTSLKNLGRSLVQHGIRVSVVVYGQDKKYNFKENGIEFYLIAQKKYKIGGWYLYRKYLQNFLNELSKKENIDLIEAADWTGITAFMKLNVPLVVRMHGSDTYFCALEKRKQKWKNKWFEEKALKNADHLISVSEFTGLKTLELFNLKKNFKVISNGVNLKEFPIEDQNILENQIFYFGSLIRKKGVLELASIFNLLVEIRQDVQLLIAGKDVKDEMEKTSTLALFQSKLTKKAKQNFKYVGEVEYTKIKFYIETAAVVVLPSFAEAFPMTWLEAMAMNKALVTSNIGWAKEIMIDGETGYMVNPEDHELYAEKLLILLGDKTLRNAMGRRSRRRILENFSTEIIAPENINFYNSVLKRNSN
ncbi:glycosyltransferase family 4 protein [Christiangramia aquimixticola]|uniref:glycosyltransferase family 4 protein n=1 Tax=Christiangramia aquimixticola TaxID=1697558 RepID=UPI003AA92A00